ncbi:Rabggta [Symbiodinium sp. CCMP2592]|nr:Rabggta [Symbiodinium sp. CCMP2592]
MHGRVKKDVVEPSPEEKEKQREQVRTARGLFGKLLEMRQSKAYSEQALDMTSKALQFHPEFPTLWGYRRELLTSGISKPLRELLEVELKLLEKALRKSQKVYSIWFHRKWVIEHLFQELKADPDSVKLLLDTELELCGRLLDVDERNFHCWNHRMHVMGLMRSWQKDQPQPIDLGSIDLKLSTDLINRNFSNYSAWHLRTLLQQRAGTEEPQMEIDINQELEWVQEGIFTEPNDQSVWLYHNWLTTLARGTETPRITHCVLMDGEVFVFFSKPVCASSASMSQGDQKLEGHLEPTVPSRKSAVQRTRSSARRRRNCALGWQFQATGGTVACGSPAAVRITVDIEVFGSLPDGKASPLSTLQVEFQGPMIDLSAPASSLAVLDAFLGERLEEQRKEVFETELERLKELLEIEPDCRWALLAQSRLQDRLVSGCTVEQQNSTQSALAESAAHASTLDPLRKNFYSDAGAAARTRQRMQTWLACPESYAKPLNLSSLSMRHLAPAIATFAFGVRVLNMDENHLREFGAVLGLISLEDLSLSKNQIQGDAAEVFVLPKLRRANLRGNLLGLRGLDVLPPKSLEYVDLSGTEGAKSLDGPTALRLLLAGSPEADRQRWTAEVVPGEVCICRHGKLSSTIVSR